MYICLQPTASVCAHRPVSLEQLLHVQSLYAIVFAAVEMQPVASQYIYPQNINLQIWDSCQATIISRCHYLAGLRTAPEICAIFFQRWSSEAPIGGVFEM